MIQREFESTTLVLPWKHVLIHWGKRVALIAWVHVCFACFKHKNG